MAEAGDLAKIDWLAAGKFMPPQTAVALVPRPALDAMLHAAARPRLLLVVCPPGYGKTTLLAQWRERLRRDGETVGWLSLDEDDADPVQTLAYMVLSLSAAGADMGELERIAVQGFAETSFFAALSSVLAAVARLPGRVTLMIDDYHRVPAKSLDGVLEGLLSRIPENFRLIVSSRERPSLSLAALRAQGLLSEVAADRLQLTADDIAPLFAGQLDRPAVERLVTRTEGWGVALQLARLWLAGAPERAAVIEQFSGRTTDVADYLAEQVLRDLPAAARQVLLETSICERISGDLANAITGRTDCWRILADLQRLNALLIPLDGERRWFRCHLLFREFLQEQLQREAPDRIPSLHAAASRWFEQNGAPVEAVRHARLMGDYDRVATLVRGTGGWALVLYGGIGTLRNLLRGLPREEVVRRPHLWIAQSYLYTKDGDIAAARALVDAGRKAGPPDPHDYAAVRDDLLIGGVIEGYEDQWLTQAEYEKVAAIEKVIEADDHLGLGCLYESLCVAAMRVGQSELVEDAAVKAVRHMRAADTILGLNYAHFHLGLTQLITGRLREAEATLREALAIAEENFGAESGQTLIAESLLAAVFYLQNDLAAAKSHLDGVVEQLETSDCWFDIFATVYATASDIVFAMEGLETALAILDRGVRIARRRGLERLMPLLLAHRIRLLVRGGEMLKAAQISGSLDFTFTLGEWRQKPWVWRSHHEAGVALAALYIAQGAPGHALEVLADIHAAAAARKHGLQLVQAIALEALALRHLGRHEDAVARIVDALRLALPEGMVRPFIDEGGAMEALLSLALRSLREAAADSLLKTQLAKLLQTMSSQGTGIAGGQDFSLREREVLTELAHGYSNKEIARLLNMTENTVKFHLKNIYAKLGVDKRGLAVARAREKALIF